LGWGLGVGGWGLGVGGWGLGVGWGMGSFTRGVSSNRQTPITTRARMEDWGVGTGGWVGHGWLDAGASIHPLHSTPPSRHPPDAAPNHTIHAGVCLQKGGYRSRGSDGGPVGALLGPGCVLKDQGQGGG